MNFERIVVVVNGFIASRKIIDGNAFGCVRNNVHKFCMILNYSNTFGGPGPWGAQLRLHLALCAHGNPRIPLRKTHKLFLQNDLMPAAHYVPTVDTYAHLKRPI